MTEEDGYTIKRRPVVQLTALLDLLFIMIFIGLLKTDPLPPPIEPPIETPTDQARTQLLEAILAGGEVPSEQGLTGSLKKLFTANMYYLDSRDRKEYLETSLWAADTEVGLVRFRSRLATRTSVVKTNVRDPLVLDPAQPIAECTQLTVSRDRIYQNCSTLFDRVLVIDCKRKGVHSYQCKENLSQGGPNKAGEWRWEYELELISVYDDRFAN